MSSPIGYPQGDSLKAASSGGAPDNQIGQNLIDQAGGYSPVAAQTNPLTGGTELSGLIVSMGETPDDTNTADYPVGTLFVSEA